MQVLELYSAPDGAAGDGILGRYRRPVATALAEAYVAAWTAQGDLVLDPFCQDATVLRAATMAGRRAVAVTGNPLIALLVRCEVSPAAPGQLEGALQRIAYAPKVDRPLGEQLDELYATDCSRCGASAPATGFVWERGAAAPVLREYRCACCGHAGREPVPGQEAPRHQAGDPQGFHRRLVAERLRLEGVPPRLLQRLLGLYTPRSLYALTALVLKLEVLFADSPLLDPLRTALLQTMDAASTLHLATEEGTRPVGSLTPPRRFYEANAWRAFRAAVQVLASQGSRQAVALAPSIEEAQVRGTACLAAGAMARLAAPLAGQVALALSQLPRFDPTFAALSYLWSGWLLGKEGARAAQHLLRQRAPGELRYLRALGSALATLGPALAPRGCVALVFQAPATRYLESLLVAAAMAGLSPVHTWHGLLDDRPAAPFAVRRVEHHVALARGGAVPPPGDPVTLAGPLAVRAAAAVLAERAEPAPFGALHAPIWTALARAGLLAGTRSMEAEALRRRLGGAVAQALPGDGALRAIAVAGDEQDAVLWASPPAPEATPLADRTETQVRVVLAAGPHDEAALQQEVLRGLPGGQAPAWSLLRACIESYGARVAADVSTWTLAEAEGEIEAGAWRRRLRPALEALGRRLGYGADEAAGYDLAWTEGGQVRAAFLVQASAALGALVRMEPPITGRRVLVIPGRRVALWRHKLAAVPPWRVALERAGWVFLRDAALLLLAEGSADRARFEAALGLGEGGSQLALFAR